MYNIFLKKKRGYTMKNIFIKATSILLVVLLLTACYPYSIIEENIGKTVTIEWEEVNFREEPEMNDNNIIQVLRFGKTVTLTGNSYSIIGDGEAFDDWTEIQLEDGTIGWVVTDSINW